MRTVIDPNESISSMNAFPKWTEIDLSVNGLKVKEFVIIIGPLKT